jgi:DNA-directed RNA polymerase subunit L
MTTETHYRLKSSIDNNEYIQNNTHYKIKIKDLLQQSQFLDTSYVNGLRRYAISNINTLAFEYSNTPMNKEYIIFEQNTSNMNNDFIGHRIGLLHVKIKYIKYILLICKIIYGHHKVLDEIKKTIKKGEKEEKEIIQDLKTNLKLSNNSNIELIQNIIFNINEIKVNNEIPVTTENIKINLYKTLEFSNYVEKIKEYIELIRIYEEYNDINELDINENLLTEINKNIFTKESYPDEEEYFSELLCKLKKNNTLQCSFRLNIGNGNKHSRWSTVCPCTYSFEVDNKLVETILIQKLEESELNDHIKFLTDDIDETKRNYINDFIIDRYIELYNFNLNVDKIEKLNEFKTSIDDLETSIKNNIIKYILDKDKLINNFNKCDKYRYYYGKEEYEYPLRIFNFSIESVGFYDSNRILYKTNKLLKNDLKNIIKKIISLLDNTYNYPLILEDIKIDSSDKIQKGIDIICDNCNHSLGNILSSYIYYLYDNKTVEYVAYKMVHPLKTIMIITIGFIENTNNKENLKAIFKNLFEIIDNFKLYDENKNRYF